MCAVCSAYTKVLDLCHKKESFTPKYDISHDLQEEIGYTG